MVNKVEEINLIRVMLVVQYPDNPANYSVSETTLAVIT